MAIENFIIRKFLVRYSLFNTPLQRPERIINPHYYFGVNAPTTSKASINLSMSFAVWVAIREMRNRLVPAGTVGGELPE